MMLDAQTIEALAAAVTRKQARMSCPVLNVDEAMELVGKHSTSAFHRWCADYGVSPCGQGRYARRQLDFGLNKEAKRRAK